MTTQPTAMTCPKCGTEQPLATACCACGLLAERMNQFRPSDDVDDPLFEGRWRELERRWEEDAAHEAFLAEAVARQWLVGAARRYRIRAGGGDERARTYLERVVRMTVGLLAGAAEGASRRKKPRRGLAIVLLLGFLAALGLVTYRALTKASLPRPGWSDPVPRR